MPINPVGSTLAQYYRCNTSTPPTSNCYHIHTIEHTRGGWTHFLRMLVCTARIIACFTFLTSSASFPSQYGLGPRENVNCERAVKLQLGSLKGRSMLKMLQVGKASSWSSGSVTFPPSCSADPSRGRTA